MVAKLRDPPEVVGRILANTASISIHYSILRAVCQRPSMLLSSSRHIKHELKKLGAIEVLIDLVGQLELSLNESIDESQLDPTFMTIVELDHLFRDLASLSGWRGLRKLSARCKKHHNRLSDIQKRLEDCLQLLVLAEASSSVSNSSTSPPTCVEAIITLPTPTTVLTTQRLQRALFASKLVERGLEAVPVAGKYISALAGVATLLLERRTDKWKQRKALKQIQSQLQVIINTLTETGVLEAATPSGKVYVSQAAPERLKCKLGEFNLLIEKANRLSRANCVSGTPLSTSNMESEVSELANRTSAFEGQIQTELSVLETHIQLHAVHLGMKSVRAQLKVVGIFFYRVRK